MTKSTCEICNIKLNWIEKQELDGATLDRVNNELLIEKDNIQIICKQCNKLKGTLTMDEYIKGNNMEIFKKTLMNKIIKNIKNMVKTD